MIYAFKDSADGCYQVELQEGEAMPEWTLDLTPCDPTPPLLTSATIPPVSPRQIRQALTRANLRQEVENAVARADQDMKDWWEFSTSFERDHPEVVAMGSTLGKTPAELDSLFELAATL